MVHPKETVRSSSGAGSDAQSPSPAAAAGKDGIVIGDSKDKIFYFVQVKRQERKENEGWIRKGITVQNRREREKNACDHIVLLKEAPFLQGVMLQSILLSSLTPYVLLLLNLVRFLICISASSGKPAPPISTRFSLQPFLSLSQLLWW